MYKHTFSLIILVCMLLIFGACTDKKAKEPVTETQKVKADTIVEPNFQVDRYWNDLSRMLGGLSPNAGSVLNGVDTLAAAKKHKATFDSAWDKKRKELLDKLSVWAEKELVPARNTQANVFYPFSGPDFMTIHTLFPNAEKYVLFGLEPEGKIPDIRKMDKGALEGNLNNLHTSIDDILLLSYFKTIDMHSDFRKYEMRGTLPVLLAFLSRTGNEVLKAERVKIDMDGTILPISDSLSQNPDDSLVTGYEIKFRRENPKGSVQTLLFFSVNVQDGRLHSSFKKMAIKLEPTHTYIKSASYLMHKPYFSQIRNLLLDVSNILLQEDSGMPLKSFHKNIWNLKFYGSYTRPIPLFANLYQEDLFQAYKTDSTVKPLNFGLGYNNFEGTSNLMLATRKKPILSEIKTQ